MTLPLFLAAYGTVLLAELAGDKMLYTVGALAARYPARTILVGIIPAYMGKALAAVMLGHVVAHLSRPLVAACTAVTFLLTALALWRARHTETTEAPVPAGPAARGSAVAFAAVFFTEWGDVGQISAAALAARYRAPLLVWLAATAALTTKGVLALGMGYGLRRYLPRSLLRTGAIVLCLVMGVLAVMRVEP